MKSIIVILILVPIVSISQKINTTESKSKSNIYNDAIKQYLIYNHAGKSTTDTLFVEKRENYGDSLLTKINGTVIQIIDWPEVNSKLDLVESFTLHRFFSLEFNKGLFSISVIPFRTTKSSNGINLGNAGGCEIIYTYNNTTKQFHYKKTICRGI